MKKSHSFLIAIFALLICGGWSSSADSKNSQSACMVKGAGIFDAEIRSEPCEGEGCESTGEVNLSLKLLFAQDGTASGSVNLVRSGLDDRNFFQFSLVSANGEMVGSCVPGESFHAEANGEGVFVLERFLGGPAIHSPARFDIDGPGDNGADLKVTFLFEDGSSFIQNLTLSSGHYDEP